VDNAESDLQKCFAINENGPKNLAIVCKAQNAFLIHISTDFVFSGDISYPLTENSPVAPKGIYGTSKLAGERMVKTFLDNHIIIRTAWLYSTFGSNFLKTILRLAKEREWLKVVFDQVGTPTYARDLAEVIIDLMYDEDLSIKTGLYHYSNEGVASWYDFALATVELSGLKTEIFPIETFEYPTPAKRPHYSVLNKGKIKNAFGIRIPHWRVSLKDCLAKLENERLKTKN
ncbi:MAG TPA: dTDP-4-dehydrorhamnose reductase, partial [Chitinophagales bacterium]